MRRAVFAFFPFCILIFPAAAADPSGIMNFFIDQAGQAIDREQQRQYQKQLQQQERQNQQILQSNWKACFGSNDLPSCDALIASPYVQGEGRNSVFQKRAWILTYAAQQEAQARAAETQRTRAQAEGAERQRQADIERQRQEAQQAEQARAQTEAAEHQRQAEIEQQRAEDERVRRSNEAEQQKRATQQVYQDNLNDCRKFDVAACDRARMSGLASEWDVSKIEKQRAVAIDYGNNRDACKSGEAAACEHALASPALPFGDKSQLAEWQRQTSPFVKAGNALANASGIVTGAIATTGTNVGKLPLSTQILSIIVALMGYALFAMRKQSAAPATGAAQAEAIDAAPVAGRQDSPLSKVMNRISVAFQRLAEPKAAPAQQAAPEAAAKESTALVVVEKPIEKAAAAQIDTPAALTALKLAQAYLEETGDGGFSDPDAARAMRTTLSLASRQMDIAHGADPNARLEIGEGIEVSQEHLRARILCQEALSWGQEKLSKAASIAERAIVADPNFARAYYVLGMLQYENRNRAAAVAALSKAVELEPDDIDSRKLLYRAQNMGAAEIATFKATKTGVKVVNAGIGVYNVGIYTRNFFAMLWNIWRFLMSPFRLVLRIFRFFAGV